MRTRDKKIANNHPTILSTTIGQLVRFNLVGILNTLVDFIIFFILNAVGITYLIAQTCSYSCGIINSYFFNKYWTFRATGITAAEIIRFAAINLVALTVSVLLVYIFHSLLHFALLPAKIAATILTMLIGFCGTKLWVFKVDVPSLD